jgi:UDP-glucose 4-epimerase
MSNGPDRMPVTGKVFLVTGGAGFIGSHLTARLLADGGRVRILDNFSTGSPGNLSFAEAHRTFLEIVRGDIRDRQAVERAASGVDVIFHQAAMRAVPRSLADPLGANDNNVTGTLHVFEAARRVGVRRVVYASSSSVYGDRSELPQREDQAVAPVSPYAVSKAVTEQYGGVWHRLYGVETVGLRYFNVFGPRQDPASQYAQVIPRFILGSLRAEPLDVHGDGTQSRDFAYVDNVVEANLLAAQAPDIGGEVFNVGSGERIDLLQIIARLEQTLGRAVARRHTPPRQGDVRHTLADVSKGKRLLGYVPLVSFAEGFARTVDYYRGI